MTKAPESYDSDLEATHAECLDCGVTQEGIFDDTCEECGSDAFEFTHVVDHPLGYDDDLMYEINTPGLPHVWAYLAADPRS